MILTVTFNPAIDKTAEVDELIPGGLNRLRNVMQDAGGKGINVSKTIYALQGKSVDPGVPELIPLKNERLTLILKSGNFGAEDFFIKAIGGNTHE